MAAHGYFGRLIFQYASFNNSRALQFFSFNNSRALHFFLGLWPVAVVKKCVTAKVVKVVAVKVGLTQPQVAVGFVTLRFLGYLNRACSSADLLTLAELDEISRDLRSKQGSSTWWMGPNARELAENARELAENARDPVLLRRVAPTGEDLIGLIPIIWDGIAGMPGRWD